MTRKTMAEVTAHGSRLEKLENLAMVIAEHIDAGDESHSMAQLARQYRETVAEIAALEDDGTELDEIAEIIGRGRPKG